MSKQQTIRFSFDKIITEQYAVIDGIFIAGSLVTVNTSLQYNFSNEAPIIKLVGHFTFTQDEKVFIKLSVSCFFRIHEDDWAFIHVKDESKFVLEKNNALHLGSLVVGVARGVLHAKTENQPYNVILLPPVDLHNIVTGDIVLAAAKKEIEKASEQNAG